MENKKITYIVFKDYDNKTTNQEGIVFFDDGTYKKIKNNREELINYLMQYAEQENITTKSELFNNDNIIHINDKINESEIIKELSEMSKTTDIYEDIEDDIEDDLEEELRKEEENTILARLKNKTKKFKVTVGAISLAALLGISGIGYHLIKNSFDKKQSSTKNKEDLQDKYEDMSFEELLNSNRITRTQKIEMTKIGQSLDNFNKDFANAHIETDKNIRASLTWDEIMALNLAYNNYSTQQITEIFNGCGESSNLLEPNKFSNAYKTALNQLTKAYVIENKEATIDLDNLINEPTEKVFYTKYHNLFLKCKDSKGQEQINNVNNFYKELIKDFNINKDTILNNNILVDEAYKLSIIPMVSASEVLFQNLEVDKTMSDEIINYFNNLELTKLASDKLNSYQTTATLSETSKYYHKYNLFKEQKIEELNLENVYYKSEELRDLSKLSEFNKAILSYNSVISNENTTSSSTSYYSNKTTTTTDRNKAVSIVGEEKVQQAEENVNNIINAENEAERIKQEQLAESKKQQLQNQEDSKKNQLQQEIDKENNQLQDNINNINNNINNNKEVSEEDFGKTDNGNNKVDIDSNHTTSNGNIDNSIKDITTEGNSNTNTPLPTPTDEGAKDGYQKDYVSGDVIMEETELTDEEIADMIIESMTRQQSDTANENTNAHTYTK